MARSRDPARPAGRIAGTVAGETPIATGRDRPGELGAFDPTREIAKTIAGVYKDAFGLGPSKTSVSFTPPETLVVVLEKTMTAEEHTLAGLGEDKRVREQRLVIAAALEQRLRSIVERTLGRRTLGFLSGIDTRRDVAVDVFTLAPESPDGA